MVGGPDLTSGSSGGGTDDDDDDDDRRRSRSTSRSSTTSSSEPDRSAGSSDRLDAPGGADTSEGDQKDRSNEPDRSAQADDRLEAPGGTDTSEEGNENAPTNSSRDEHSFSADENTSGLHEPTLTSGGDATLSEENIGKESQREEQFGDIDWSRKTGLDFAFGNTQEDEVENALRRGSDKYSEFVGGVAGGVTNVLSSSPDRFDTRSDDLDSDTEQRVADISRKEEELGSMYDDLGVTNPREIENAGAKTAGATVRNLGEVGNIPSYAVTGIEAVEYGKYAGSQDAGTTVDETADAAGERGRQVLQYYKENPTEAAGAATALAVSAPASSAGIKGLSRVSPKAGRAASAAADPVRTTIRTAKSARSKPDLDQPIPGTRSRDFGSDDPSLREKAGKFLRDERGMAQTPRRRGESETESETTDEYGDKTTQKLRDPEEDGVDIQQRAKEDVEEMVKETERWKRTNVPPRNRGPLETDELTGELPPKKEFPSDKAYNRELERLRERQSEADSEIEGSTQTDTDSNAELDADAAARDIDADTAKLTEDISGTRGSKGGIEAGASVAAASNVVQTDAVDSDTTENIGRTVEAELEANESEVSGTILSGINDELLAGRSVTGVTTTADVTRDGTRTGTDTDTTTETTVETETETEITQALEQELAIETSARGRTGGFNNPDGSGIPGGGSGGGGRFDRQFNIDPATPDDIISGEALDLDDIDFEG